MIALDTATCAMLWRKQLPGNAWSLIINGGVVVIPVDECNTMVLDVTSGHQYHALPSAEIFMCGLCVFEGLTNGFILITCFHIEPGYATERAILDNEHHFTGKKIMINFHKAFPSSTRGLFSTTSSVCL